MVNSSEIPSNFTTQWKAGASQPPLSASNESGAVSQTEDSSAAGLKYRSSCNKCRVLRVKCSGGNPCQRCADSPDLTSCVYGVSQRRGRRKAGTRGLGDPNRDVHPQQVLQPNPPFGGLHPLDGQPNTGDAMQVTFNQPWSTGDQIRPLAIDPGVSADGPMFDQSSQLLAHNSAEGLDIFALQDPPMSPFQFHLDTDLNVASDRSYSCSCSISNQSSLVGMLSAINDPKGVDLGKLLQALRDSSTHAVSYFNCSYCEGCPRLANLSMLHQRQVRLLCHIVKNPAIYLNSGDDETTRLTLGSYRLSKQEDSECKRIIVLKAAQNIELLVSRFDETVKGESAQTVPAMSEVAELTLKWLLDIARNLKSRLEVVITTLERSDWALAVDQC
ncbi:hypothetical protein F4677DRAFT_420960 [Hypoxylon crocopeplum]|nr:hypothetical protein F4677DRAFT_420960 [Hypoxylon crocopeplum]